jgi:hypothetical protein
LWCLFTSSFDKVPSVLGSSESGKSELKIKTRHKSKFFLKNKDCVENQNETGFYHQKRVGVEKPSQGDVLKASRRNCLGDRDANDQDFRSSLKI